MKHPCPDTNWNRLALLAFYGMLLTGIAILPGCGGVNRISLMEKFNRTADAYRDAIRWSDFETAGRFRDMDGDGSPGEKQGGPEHIKVTSYEIIRTVPSPDHTRVDQYVDIGFYDTRTLRLESTRDHQVWKYDPEKGAWRIESELPDFRN